MPPTDTRRYFGPYTLIEDEPSCLRDGHDIGLYPQEFELLKVFLDNSGQWLSKPALFSALWPNENVDVELDNRIQVLVSNLKKKLDSPGKDYIRGRRRTGYRFDADVAYARTIPDEDCPWPGLRFVGEERAKYFYGRDYDILQMTQKLERHNFLVVTSSSGIGKSSLVRAGLVPSLKAQAEATGERVVSAIFTPTAEPLRQLAEQLLKLMQLQVTEEAIDQTIQSLSADAEGLKAALEVVEGDRILLVIDQFEELTLCRDKAQREIFVDNLMTAISGLPNRLWIVLTLRVDLYSQFQAYPALWRQLSNQHNLSKLSRDQLREVIEKPAESIDLSLDEGLADQILNDLGDERTSVPLLSHTMGELFKRRKGTRLTFESYHSIGGVGKAIGTHAQKVYKRFPPAEQTLMRAIMIDLIQVGDRSEHDVRRPKPFRELTGQGLDAEQRATIIRVLCDERLLFKGELPDESVEICHEALIHHWWTLGRWINDGRDALRRFDRLRNDSEDWEKSNRDSTLLYQGTKLADAHIAIARYSEFMKPKVEAEFLGTLHSKFINASDVAHKRRRRRALFLKIALGVLATSIVYVTSRWFEDSSKRREIAQQRDRAESRRLSADAISQLSNDPELSLLLAIEAGKLASTQETDIALRRALTALDQRAVYLGHKAQVISICVSPDGRSLLTAGADREARIWDIAERTTKSVFQGHTDWVNSAAYSPDGTRIITAGRDAQIRIWDVTTRETVKIISGHEGSVQNAVFSSDGKRILSAGEDGTVRLWNAETGKALLPPLKASSNWVNVAIFSPDDNLIASAGGDGTVGLWNSHTGQKLKTFPAHQGTVIGVAFDKEGRRLVTAGSDKTAKVWDTGTWQAKTELRGHTGPVFSVEFSRNGKWVLTSSKDGTAKVWDAESGLELKAFRGHRSAINGAVFSDDGNYAYTASGDGTVRMWAIEFGQRVGSLRGHSDVVVKTTFSPDGNGLVTASHDNTVRLWNVKTLQQARVLLHPASVEDVVFSADGTLIATAGADGIGRIWKTNSGELSRTLIRSTLPEAHKALTSVSISSDNEHIISGAEDGTLQLWDVTTGTLLKNWQAHKEPTGRNLGPGILAVVFSPENRFVATSGGDNVVRLWNVANQTKEAEWDLGTGAINSVAFSKNGQYLVGACKDQTARVWSISDKRTIAVLRGHDNSVVSANFSPDTELLLTASFDKTARLWEIGANEVLSIFAWNNAPLTGASFSSNGTTIAIADSTGLVQLYACEICAAHTQDLLRIAENHRTRELTPSERQRFLVAN